MKSDHLHPLADAEKVETYGGKAASLARLLRAGVATAPGFVLHAGALEAQLARLGLAGRVEALYAAVESGDRDGLRSLSGSIREPLLAGELDPALLSALNSRVTAGVLYAVRSSAPGEDGAEDSFAGQFDSVLGCASPEAVAAAVRRVWASLFGERALLYALHRKTRPRGMAVIIQQQVDARVSGVMFTRDTRPQYPDALLVEYCAGLGESLVSGEVVPGRFRIDRGGGSLTVEQSPDHEVAVDPAGPDKQALLLESALTLEALFGSALDVEWSLDGQGALVILQARPITARNRSGAGAVWTNANIAENFPDPVCPLLESFVGRGYGAYFRGLGVAFGISKRRLAAMAEPLDQLVGSHAGRLYYNLTNIHTVLHLAPGGPWLARFFNQFTGAEDFPPPEVIRRARWIQGLETFWVALHVGWRYLRVGRSLRAFERKIDAYGTASDPRKLDRLEPSALVDLMRRFLDIRLNHWTGGALSDTAAMVCYGLLKLILRGADPNDLLKGLPGLASAVPVERLWDLSRLLREDPELHALVQNEPAETVWERLRAGAFPAFHSALNRYFDRWGFRYSGELMLSRATPCEDPLPVLRLLRSYAALAEGGPAEVSQRQAAAREVATRAAGKRLKGLAALAFGPVLRATQGAIRFRERARMKQALLYTRLRHVALALGRKAVTRDQLDQAEDVLFLTIDEAVALGEGDGRTVDAARERVAKRRTELAAAQPLCPPDRMVLPAGEAWRPGEGPESVTVEGEGALTGTGACGGRVSGQAAVVLDVADIDRIRSDQILVTRQTDPGWAAVFFMIKGLVIERGGMLSHGAIIAREYGIPAVVGVRKATEVIKDGEELRICGDEGRVEYVRP